MPFLGTGEEFPIRSKAKTVSYACDIILPTEQEILHTKYVSWVYILPKLENTFYLILGF